MIITNQQPSSPSSKRSFPAISTRPPSPTSEYDAPPAYHVPPPSSPNPPPTPNKTRLNTGSRRFWRIVMWGLVIYVVVSATVVTPLLVIKLRASKTVQEPDPVQTSDSSADLPEKPQWPGPGPHWPPHRGDGDGRWDLPPPHEGGPRGPPFEGGPPREGGPHRGPPHGPHGWKAECGSEGDERPGCHRPPNVPQMDGRIVKCNGWRLPTPKEQRPVDDLLPFNSFLKYELPLDQDIFVRAAGKTTGGTFTVVVNDKIKTIEARVEMLFNEHKSYEHTNVCLMERHHSNPPAMGLGIYMPFGQDRNESISFNIALHVPPMIYNHTLDTHLPVFAQTINSDPRVYYNRLRLSGSASPMLLRGVDAGTVDAKTVYAPIKADSVRAGKKIRLATNASPIDAIIAVKSNSSTAEPVSIDLQTINAHIAGTVLLEHDGATKLAPQVETNDLNPDFALDAKTGNSPIFLRVMHIDGSEPSILRANLTTTLGDIELAVDPWFEGAFELETDMSAANVEEDAKHTMDPTGIARRRVVSMKREREGAVHGFVQWKHMSFRLDKGEGIWQGDKTGAKKNVGGRIRATTSYAQNTLLLPSAQDMLKDTAERAALFSALNEVDGVEERMRKAGSDCGERC